MKVLIPGISGRLAQHASPSGSSSAGHEVIGIDRRPWPRRARRRRDARGRHPQARRRGRVPQASGPRPSSTWRRSRTSSRRARSATASTSAARARSSSTAAHVRREHVVFVGRHTYYGAARRLAALPHRGRAADGGSTTFPELADLVAADLYAATALWRYPELATTRAAHRATRSARPGTARSPRSCAARACPTVLGFDPLFQFMHEERRRRRASRSRSRSGRAASSTSPARSRCRSRW